MEAHTHKNNSKKMCHPMVTAFLKFSSSFHDQNVTFPLTIWFASSIFTFRIGFRLNFPSFSHATVAKVTKYIILYVLSVLLALLLFQSLSRTIRHIKILSCLNNSAVRVCFSHRARFSWIDLKLKRKKNKPRKRDPRKMNGNPIRTD